MMNDCLAQANSRSLGELSHAKLPAPAMQAHCY